ncbi:MAG TPA: ATP-grasp domain-containing protein [Gaiellaceae bacterium]|nr:ATP-grasp domain-containing protein [Gaiellaceae bacterium]
MRDLTVLVTASGAPGTAALVRALRENGERRVRVVGIDMAELAIGRHLCDAFHVVPPGDDPGFADAIVEVSEREGVDVVLPQSSYDLTGLAAARERFPCAVLVSSPEAVRRSNDKAETYALLDAIGAPGPQWRRARGKAAVDAAARELGYPDEEVAVKPLESSGSRGFRILSAGADPLQQLLTNRPGVAPAMQLEELLTLLPDGGGPELLVMELARGKERTIDGVARGGRIVLGHPKTREAMRAGLAMYFETLDDSTLMDVAASIVRELELDHFFNIQLVGDTVIEINPRISTVVYQEDLNLPYLGVKLALGEVDEDELAAKAARIRPTRRALRFFDQVEWDE